MNNKRYLCTHMIQKKALEKKKRERKRRIIYASYPYPSGLFAYCCIRHFLHILFMTREASIKWLTGAVQQDLVVELLGRKVGMVWYSCLLIAHIGAQEVSVLQHSWPNSKPSPCAETLVDPGGDAQMHPEDKLEAGSCLTLRESWATTFIGPFLQKP